MKQESGIAMTKAIEATSWVYVLVQNPGGDEQIVGQQDSENGLAFIPLFLDKESAIQGLAHMPTQKGKKLEIQAIIFEDLANYAARDKYLLFVLDADGKVIDKRLPES
jgi:hypothetical protein